MITLWLHCDYCDYSNTSLTMTYSLQHFGTTLWTKLLSQNEFPEIKYTVISSYVTFLGGADEWDGEGARLCEECHLTLQVLVDLQQVSVSGMWQCRGNSELAVWLQYLLQNTLTAVAAYLNNYTMMMLWLHNDDIMITQWWHYDYTMVTLWLHNGDIMITLWWHYDYTIITLWLHYDYIVSTVWLQ